LRSTAEPCGDHQAMKVSLAGILDLPVYYGTLLIRVEVKNNGTDLTYARQIVDSCTLATVPRTAGTNNHVPALSNAAFEGISNFSSPAGILELTARISLGCQPLDTATDPTAQLRVAGLYGGQYHRPDRVNLTAASAETSAAIGRYSNNQDLGNGWSRILPAGVYGSNYVSRALIAEVGYLELVGTEALYPRYTTGDSTGLMSLTTSEAYLFTFAGKPPLRSTVFLELDNVQLRRLSRPKST